MINIQSKRYHPTSSQSRPNHFKLDHTKPNHIYTSIYNLMENSTVQLIFDLINKNQKSIYKHYTHPNTNIFAFDLKNKNFGFNLIIFIRRFIKVHHLYTHSFFVWFWIVHTLYILVLLCIYLSKDILFNEYLPVSKEYWQLIYTLKNIFLSIDI